MPRTIKLSIDVTVTAGSGRTTLVSEVLNSAVQELVNRHDFRTGSIKQGRVVEVSIDHEDISAVVDLTILRVGE